MSSAISKAVSPLSGAVHSNSSCTHKLLTDERRGQKCDFLSRLAQSIHLGINASNMAATSNPSGLGVIGPLVRRVQPGSTILFDLQSYLILHACTLMRPHARPVT